MTERRERAHLKTRREELKLSQGDVAVRAGIQQQHYSGIETGRIKKLDDDLVARVAKALGLSKAVVRSGPEAAPKISIVGALMPDDCVVEAEGELVLVEALPPGFAASSLRAIRVDTDAYEPKWERGEYLLVGEEDRDIGSYIGRWCLVGLADGCRVLKRIGQVNGHETLLVSLRSSIGPVLSEPEWVRPVLWTKHF